MMDKNLRYSLLFNYKILLISFVHKRQTHFLTNISSNGGVRHPICDPLKHNSQINIIVTFENYLHNINYKPTRKTNKDGSIWPSTLKK
jgi:hypothetical protein